MAGVACPEEVHIWSWAWAWVWTGAWAVMPAEQVAAAYATCTAQAEAEAYGEAARCFQELAEAAPDSEAGRVGRFNGGYNYLMAGEAAAALRELNLYVERYPTSREAPLALGWIARELERQEPNGGGLETYERLATSYPEHQDAADAQYNAGVLRLQRGDHAEAAAWFEAWVRAQVDAPDRAEVAKRAAEAWTLAGKPARARRVLALVDP